MTLHFSGSRVISVGMIAVVLKVCALGLEKILGCRITVVSFILITLISYSYPASINQWFCLSTWYFVMRQKMGKPYKMPTIKTYS